MPSVAAASISGVQGGMCVGDRRGGFTNKYTGLEPGDLALGHPPSTVGISSVLGQ